MCMWFSLCKTKKSKIKPERTCTSLHTVVVTGAPASFPLTFSVGVHFNSLENKVEALELKVEEKSP